MARIFGAKVYLSVLAVKNENSILRKAVKNQHYYPLQLHIRFDVL